MVTVEVTTVPFTVGETVRGALGGGDYTVTAVELVR
jgi:hypothetical protein